MKRTVVLIIISFFIGVTAVRAETIFLKNGTKVQGQIIEKTEKGVKVNVKGVTLTYDDGEIQQIKSGSSATSILPTKTVSSLAPLPVKAVSSGAAGQEGGASSSGSGDQFAGMTKRDLIVALMEASGAREKLTEVFSQAMSKASPEEAVQLQQIFNTDEMINEVIPVYNQYFTEDELRDLILFYRSPLGRKLFMVTPLVVEDSIKASLTYFQNKMQAAEPGQQLLPQAPPPSP